MCQNRRHLRDASGTFWRTWLVSNLELEPTFNFERNHEVAFFFEMGDFCDHLLGIDV